jgi:3-oxoacyl-(acyl-carrier-protein) synthase/acyl carrier protein
MKLKNKKLITNIAINNPFVQNHWVQGQAVFPGLAYIDLLFQIAQTNGFNVHQTVLKNLSIYNPLVLKENSAVELTLSFTEIQGVLKILIEGSERRNDGTADLNHQKYVSAELHQQQTLSFERIIDVSRLESQSQFVVGMEEAVYAPARNNGLVHREIMKAEGVAYSFDGDYIAELSVPSKYREDAGSYLFHPALIDSGAMASLVAIRGVLAERLKKQEPSLFLPIFFESFSASEALNTECFVRVAALELINDIIYCNLEFFNRAGKQVGVLKRLTSKLIRAGEQIAATTVRKTPPVSQNLVNEIRPNLKNSSSSLQSKVLAVFGRYLALRPEQIDPQHGFFDLGLESVHLLEIVKELEILFNTTLNPTLLFECNNIRELTAYLQNELAIPTDVEESIYEFYDHEPYLQDHLVFGKPALMGVTHPACVIEELLRRRESLPLQLDRLQFVGGPVTPGANEVIHVRVVFEESKGRIQFRSEHFLNDAGQVKPCLTGQYIKPGDTPSEKIDIRLLLNQGKRLDAAELERIYTSTPGFGIGAMVKTIEAAYLIDPTTMVVKVNLTDKMKKGNRDSFVFDPLVLNSCYSSCIFENAPKNVIFIPLMIESLCVFSQLTKISYIVTTVNKATGDFVSFDSMIINDTGEIAAKVVNASLKSVEDPAKLDNAAFDSGKELLTATQTLESRTRYRERDIAIIGVAGRYPQARNLSEFWRNLRDGKDCITEVPLERWDHSLYYDADKTKPGKTYSKWGGFLGGVDQFDPLFFNISPREAEGMDPQERLFLECVYETLEDAGYTREELKYDKVGLFVGVMNGEYQLYGAQAREEGFPIALSGNIASVANRISYFCDFHGPSLALDTMCSSSLTALHLACRSIRYGECKLAIAGGVNLIVHPNKYLLLAQGKFISSKGRCESFGQGGDGYVPGEGVGAILLKPLSKAVAAGDHIYGVIKGTAMNHGGRTSGFTVPNPKAQAEVIREALKDAEVDPRTISYIEAHGTGTSLGDPIEIAGLVTAFEKHTETKQFCAVGSAKSNIGHSESAAGIAGITKVLLQLKNRQLVASLHSEVLNPNIDFANTPFAVQRELTEWERPVVEINGETKEYPRIAGISSFGAGGSNAHVIIAEYISEGEEETPIKMTSQNPALIVLSAKNEERLREQVQQLLTAIADGQYGDDNLADMAYTLQVGREAMEERLGVIASSMKGLAMKLAAFLEGQSEIADLYRGQVKRNRETMAVFAADEELLEAVAKWIARQKYGKLLELWVKGLGVDWNRIYDGAVPKRISLPTYPFLKERYWITKNTGNPQFHGDPVPNSRAPEEKNGQLQLGRASDVQNVATDRIAGKPSPIKLLDLTPTPLAGSITFLEPGAIPQQFDPTPPIRPLVASGVNAPTVDRVQLLSELISSLAELLYITPGEIDIDKKFIDMGLDSVFGVDWIQQINSRYKVEIATTKIYDYPTIKELAHYLENKLASKPLIRAENPPMESETPLSKELLPDELGDSPGETLKIKPGEIDINEVFQKVYQGAIRVDEAGALINQFTNVKE